MPTIRDNFKMIILPADIPMYYSACWLVHTLALAEKCIRVFVKRFIYRRTNKLQGKLYAR